MKLNLFNILFYFPQVKDARAALDALREEESERKRREAEEVERQRQIQMQQKLDLMRQKKQEYLQYQRQLALQRMQEQEREMQLRQEQAKQLYLQQPVTAASGTGMAPPMGMMPPQQQQPMYPGYMPQQQQQHPTPAQMPPQQQPYAYDPAMTAPPSYQVSSFRDNFANEGIRAIRKHLVYLADLTSAATTAADDASTSGPVYIGTTRCKLPRRSVQYAAYGVSSSGPGPCRWGAT